MSSMTKLAKEAVKLIDALPPEKARALLDYARFLAEHADEEAWEHRLNEPKYLRKLKDLGEKARREFRAGKTRLLDPNKM